MSDSANPLTDMGGGIVYSGKAPPMSVEAAQNALMQATGVPDIQAGVNALTRGDTLAGIGQTGAGLLQAGSLLWPAGRAVMPLAREAVAASPAVLADTAGSLRAWHGTPHTFEPVEHNPFGEFRDSAIGSGEGAQAYGWGHYVAGNPKVAADYQHKLSDLNVDNHGIIFNGKTVDDLINSGMNLTELESHWPLNVRSALGQTQGDPDRAIALAKTWESSYGDKVNEITDWIDKNRDSLGWKSPSGALLEVHVLPEEHELLDWDRPLSQQHPDVQKGLEKFDPPSDFRGEDIYHWLSRSLGNDQAASQALHEAGIPGIKYLDQGSRQAGEGTRNYVIFHPSNLRIIGRNGQRLEPVDHDPFAGEAP